MAGWPVVTRGGDFLARDHHTPHADHPEDVRGGLPWFVEEWGAWLGSLSDGWRIWQGGREIVRVCKESQIFQLVD